MTDKTAKRVTMLADFEYHPKGNLAWFRKFRAGWTGPVTPAQHAAMLSAGVIDEPATKAKGDAGKPDASAT